MQTYKIIIGLIIITLFAVFTLQNAEAVPVNFLLWSISVSLCIVVLVALFLGVIIGLFLSFLNNKKKLKQG